MQDAHTEVRIREALPSDAELLADLDKACRGQGGNSTDYRLSLGCNGFQVYVAERFDSSVGFAAVEVWRPAKAKRGDKADAVPSIKVWAFGVLPEWRRKGVASQLVATLKTLMGEERCEQIVAEVPETSLDAQLFLKSQDFRCVETLPNHKENESWYRFIYRPTPTNRVAKYLRRTACLAA